MKRYALLALATVFMINVAVVAQNPTAPQKKDIHQRGFKHAEKPQMSAQKRAGYLAVDLELTDAQRTKVQALFEKQDKIREQRMAEVKKMREQEMAKIETERKAQEAEMEQIIGKEKFQQLEMKRHQMKEKVKQKMRERINERRHFALKDSTFHGKRGPRDGKRLQEVK